MNENIDLTKILKDCPVGWKFYSSVYGAVNFWCISEDSAYPIISSCHGHGTYNAVTKRGITNNEYAGECTFFPSKEQRDWSKFTAPWYKMEKFDPKTLKPFDKVLVRSEKIFNWNCSLFSNIDNFSSEYPFSCLGLCYRFCIPCNDYTKHLIGTTEEAPEYYRYWED